MWHSASNKLFVVNTQIECLIVINDAQTIVIDPTSTTQNVSVESSLHGEVHHCTVTLPKATYFKLMAECFERASSCQNDLPKTGFDSDSDCLRIFALEDAE